jgi:transposase-like protein
MAKRIDEQLALAIAMGASVEAAAERLGISKSTAYRRWRDPVVKRRVADLRRDITDRSIGQLVAGLADAITVARQLMRESETESLRLKAAALLIETGLKAAAIAQLEQRIVDLETAMKGDQCLTT